MTSSVIRCHHFAGFWIKLPHPLASKCLCSQGSSLPKQARRGTFPRSSQRRWQHGDFAWLPINPPRKKDGKYEVSRAGHIFNLRSSEQETTQRKDIKVLTMQILPGFSQNMHTTHTHTQFKSQPGHMSFGKLRSETGSSNYIKRTCSLPDSPPPDTLPGIGSRRPWEDGWGEGMVLFTWLAAGLETPSPAIANEGDCVKNKAPFPENKDRHDITLC